MKDLLRKYPQWSHDCIAVVGNVSSKHVHEAKAKAALLWMLGEYASDMSDAPYAIEGFVENWADEDSPEVNRSFLLYFIVMFCFAQLLFSFDSKSAGTLFIVFVALWDIQPFDCLFFSPSIY